MRSLDKNNAALLAMDFQNDIVDPTGKFGSQAFAGHVEQRHVIETASQAVATARDKGVAVVHVRVAWPEGHPAINMSAPLFAGVKQLGALVDGTWGADFHPAMKPAEGELTITKRAVSAFAGTDLDDSLRARSVTTLVLTGVATSFVIEGTARDAADLGYSVIVLGDCCATFNDEMHNCSLQVLSHLAQVSTLDEFIQSL